MRHISLTSGLIATVDEDDYAYLSQFSWHASWNTRAESYYARRKVMIEGRQRTILMHREVLGLAFGDKRLADHRNCHDTLNNQKSNLRVSSSRQNAQNRPLRSDSRSGYKGVRFRRNKNRWSARITVNGRTRDLGLFKTPELAYDAYCKAAVECFGEFACLA